MSSTPRRSSSSLIRSVVLGDAEDVADGHHRQRLDALDGGDRVEHRRLHLDAEVPEARPPRHVRESGS